ncbi:MAG: efflux transporter outer membrane subunit [Planctomycetes bacterium]|nr:efflux transporter outer membrane subunit [Planctomycetota bacterium]
MSQHRRWHRYLAVILALTGLSASSSGCRVTARHDFSDPPVAVPDRFRSPESSDAAPVPLEWWAAFGDDELDHLVRESLERNIDLRVAWDRLRQSVAEARIAGAALLPQVDVNGGASLTRTVQHGGTTATFPGARVRRDESDDQYFVGLGLGYEVDLWGRIAAQRSAATLRAQATREDAEATALLVSGRITDLWLTVIEQRALRRLVLEQIETNRRFLELTELRLSLGEGSALDVMQQRQQTAATQSELPVVESALEAAVLQLEVLLGRPPTQRLVLTASAFPDLPPWPELPAPAELCGRRPDLRAALRRLEATDEEVAAAVADRLPRLAISLDYDLSAPHLGRLFEREVTSLIGNFVAPLIDGGRRRAEVERRQSLVQQSLGAFAQSFLDALLEVESAIARERHQRVLIDRLREQVDLARQTVEESRSRYSNGLDSFLSVLTALQSLQQVERRFVTESRRLLTIRAELYRALGGGGWTRALEPSAPRELREIELPERPEEPTP